MSCAKHQRAAGTVNNDCCKRSCLMVLLCCSGLALAMNPDVTTDGGSSMRCEYFNETQCANKTGCTGSEHCKSSENEKAHLCYTLWQNASGVISLKLKGCWVGNKVECTTESCTVKHLQQEPQKQLLFCCCEGEMCNTNITPSPPVTSTVAATIRPTTPLLIPSRGLPPYNIVIYILAPILGVAVVVIIAYYVYRRHKMAHFNEVPTAEPTPLPSPSPFMGMRSLQLIEIKAQGRFGAVWKAQITGEFVAVKIFPPQDRASWMVEKDIFKLPQMKHDHILAFLGAGKQGDNLNTEYWLVTAYHENGSLCDYLKANLVTWGDVLSIADSISKGLMHLHEELPPTKSEAYKPAVAHRDFKSKNVLLKSDMTACIADFGLALVFLQGTSPGEAHGQVGTRRYMAPEVLEGAINFSRDAFLRIDMYACALVLWELLSRCNAQDGPVEEYMLPFEEEIGQHPTLEDMQEVVTQKKLRPKLKDIWKKHPGLAALCDTIEECWDHDAEARLSASCVQERVSFLYRNVPPTSGNQGQQLGNEKGLTTSGKIPVVSVKCPLSSTVVLLPPKESSI